MPSLIADQIAMFERLNDLDWADIEPSIFGTLFERIIDESKRKQLGTHYTSREDIELIIEPVPDETPARRLGRGRSGIRAISQWEQ